MCLLSEFPAEAVGGVVSAVHGAVVVGHGVQVVAVVALVGSLGVRAHLQPLQRKLDQRVLLPPRNVLAKPTTHAKLSLQRVFPAHPQKNIKDGRRIIIILVLIFFLIFSAIIPLRNSFKMKALPF
jgi:hypothetical protein